MDRVSGPAVVPVILCGGSGTRLWPVSREQCPKQFVPLMARGVSLFQETVARAEEATGSAPVVVCNRDHLGYVEEQLTELGVTPAAVVCEPVARNTALAVAAAAEAVGERDPQSLLLVLPSDHLITERARFGADVAAAAPAAAAGHLVTFGITPESPHTGFGYIHVGPGLAGIDRVHHAEEFVEKPDLDLAAQYVSQGKWLWNSGMFLFACDVLLEEVKRYEPRTAAAAALAVRDSVQVGVVRDLEASACEAAPSVSLDYALMERTDRAAVLPSELEWSDVGSWSSLWEISPRDASGNVSVGDVVAEQATNCYLRSEGPLLTVAGLDDLTVVATDDAVLVADRRQSQGVRKLVTTLRDQGRREADSSPLVRRPWGSFRSLEVGPTHQVKHLVVQPGKKLSLQRHQHRAEHWVVVEGAGCAVIGNEVRELAENESLFVPQGGVHRLENRGSTTLHVIEVQVGEYLGEDDIERLADDYGRS